MIKLLILDVDGVLTDGKKYYDSKGTVVMKTFCDKDWTAIKRFKAIGVQVVFLTGDPFNTAIASKRNIDCIVNRKDGKHTDKADYLTTLCDKYNVVPENVAFVGDDIFDLGLMQKVKYKYCPADAPEELQEIVTDIIHESGGHNCIMVLWDMVTQAKLIPKYKIEQHMEDVYKLDIKEKF